MDQRNKKLPVSMEEIRESLYVLKISSLLRIHRELKVLKYRFHEMAINANS